MDATGVAKIWDGFKRAAAATLHAVAHQPQAREVIHQLEDAAVQSLSAMLNAELSNRGLPSLAIAGARVAEGAAGDSIKGAVDKALDGA